MFLDLNKIGPEGLELSKPLQVPDLDAAAGERIAVLEVRLTAEVARGKRGFDLSGRLEARLRLTCSRCLEPFVADLDPEFSLVLVPGGEAVAAAAADDEDAAALFPCPEGKADLVHMAAEQIYLNLPLKPICRDGCKGLCPVCGANRNATECGCRAEPVDPRLAPLLTFKTRRNDD